MADEKAVPQPPGVSRRDFFAKLLRGVKYAAPSVMVMSMTHLAQGQSSQPMGMGMGGGVTMGMP